jgi:trehalose 6-phosphate phosphatase
MRAILVLVSAAATLAELLGPLRADPARAAILLDVDGTLAPITRHAADAHVPETTRLRLIEVSKRYGTVACVSGRPASVARRIVAIGSIAYVGNHGCELLRPGASEVQIDPEVAPWTERVRAFAERADELALQRLRVRREEKGPIVAFHWRGAPDEDAALAAMQELEREAHREGFATHWGRKVLEVRPPTPIDKGRGITTLLAGGDLAAALYAGDDTTDLDAFRALRELFGEGALCVGVRSDEAPAELEREADLMVDGPGGVRSLLEGLLD